MKHTRSLFLQKFYNIGKFLACLPFYDFKNHTLIYSFYNKMYTLLVAIVLGTSMLYSCIKRHNISNYKYTRAHIILDFVNEFCSIMIVETVTLGSTIFYENQWTNLIENFRSIDEKLNWQQTKHSYFGNVYLQFFLLLVAFMACNFFHLLGWLYASSVPLLFLARDVAYCYEFFIELFVCKILWDFRDKYKKLYKMLDSSMAGSRKMIKVMELNSISSIRKFERLTRTMADMVTDLNKIFGWPLAFIILTAVLQLLSTAIHILIDAQMKNFHETKHLLISKLALTGLMIVELNCNNNV
jgi:hypothetical protein